MATTYKAEQIKFVIKRLQQACNDHKDRLDILQLVNDARIVGATKKQVEKILTLSESGKVVKRCDLCGGQVIENRSKKQVPGVGIVKFDSCMNCNKIQ